MNNLPNDKHYFGFPDMEDVNNFSFEKLTAENYQILVCLFSNDDSPFTEDAFKHDDTAKKYAVFIDQHGARYPKHGCQDWFFKIGNKYTGILHLYDLSLETFNDNHRRCWIGFAVAPEMRRQGIAQKVVTHFIDYILNNYPGIHYIHAMTMQNNLPARELLQKTGFKEDNAERIQDKYSFYLMTR